jgi:hypothetical protein
VRYPAAALAGASGVDAQKETVDISRSRFQTAIAILPDHLFCSEVIAHLYSLNKPAAVTAEA